MGKIILDVHGTPASEESPCLKSGYGYYAYVSSNDGFFMQLMTELSLWSGATKTFHTTCGEFFDGFELDCRNKKFLTSDTFKKICQRCKVELVICDEDITPLREFFDSVIGR